MNIRDVMAYGTSEGVKKEWDTRGRKGKEDPKEMSNRLQDAYSSDRYGRDWSPHIKMMRQKGFSDEETEAIIRSKHTRWAADEAGKESGMKPKDLASYLDKYKITPGSKEAKGLVAGTI